MISGDIIFDQEVIPTVTLTDVDGTTSDTRVHMQGYNDRLANAFPEIPEGLLQDLGAARVAYRNKYAELTHAQQSELWNRQHPGLSLDSQTSFFEGEAPDIFTPELMSRIRAWGEDPENFGHGEYDDVAPFLDGLHRVGSLPVLVTLGSRERATGEPGWQERKVLSAPSLRPLARYVAESLPEGGKGELIGTWYDADADVFQIPRTDGGEVITSRGALLVDDVEHNVAHTHPRAMAVLLDRKGKYEGRRLPSNVRRVQSLTEVPAIVRNYDMMRRRARRG